MELSYLLKWLGFAQITLFANNGNTTASKLTDWEINGDPTHNDDMYNVRYLRIYMRNAFVLM